MDRSALKAPAPRAAACLRKVRRSISQPCIAALHAHHHEGHIVALCVAMHEFREFVRNVFDYLLRCLVSRRQQQLFEFLLAQKSPSRFCASVIP